MTLDDGGAPPQPVVVELVCNGRARPIAHTDLKGGFGFRLGDRSAEVMGDASVSGVPGGPQGGPLATLANDGFDSAPLDRGFGGLSGRTAHRPGMVDLTGCELVARLPGYSSSRLYLGRRSAVGDSNLGTIVLSRLRQIDGSAVSSTSLAAPPKARRFFEKGLQEARTGKSGPRRAIGPLERAVQEYPAYANAWAMLGELRAQTGDLQGAREALERAIEADERYLRPYPPLIQLHLSRNNWEDAARLADTLARLNPYLTEARFYHAYAAFNLRDLEAAERSLIAMQTAEDAGRFPQRHRMLAFIHLQRRDFPQAAEEMRAFVKAAPQDPQAQAIAKKLQEWESLGVVPPEYVPADH